MTKPFFQWVGTNEIVDLLATSNKSSFGVSKGDVCDFVIQQKMLGENANKIYHVNEAMVVNHIFLLVLHNIIYNRIIGIQSPGYPGIKIWRKNG